jgi:hypothetical protein
VKLVEEEMDSLWRIGMSDDHQDDSQGLADGDDGIALHG